MAEFYGEADDVARLALQRLLKSDVRYRAHRKAARFWQILSLFITVIAALAAAGAAVVSANNLDHAIVITFAVVAAMASATQTGLSANVWFEKHNSASRSYESIANQCDRYIHIQIGPIMWRNLREKLSDLADQLGEIDKRMDDIAETAPVVKLNKKHIEASKLRASKVIEYFQKNKNIDMPPEETWAT